MADAAQRAAFAGAPPSPCQAPTTLTLSEPTLAAQAEAVLARHDADGSRSLCLFEFGRVVNEVLDAELKKPRRQPSPADCARHHQGEGEGGGRAEGGCAHPYRAAHLVARSRCAAG